MKNSGARAPEFLLVSNFIKRGGINYKLARVTRCVKHVEFIPDDQISQSTASARSATTSFARAPAIVGELVDQNLGHLVIVKFGNLSLNNNALLHQKTMAANFFVGPK